MGQAWGKSIGRNECLYTPWLCTDHLVVLAPQKKESGTTLPINSHDCQWTTMPLPPPLSLHPPTTPTAPTSKTPHYNKKDTQGHKQRTGVVWAFFLLTHLISFLVSYHYYSPFHVPSHHGCEHLLTGWEWVSFLADATTTANESGRRQQWHQYQCQRHVTEPPPHLRATARRGKWWCCRWWNGGYQAAGTMGTTRKNGGDNNGRTTTTNAGWRMQDNEHVTMNMGRQQQWQHQHQQWTRDDNNNNIRECRRTTNAGPMTMNRGERWQTQGMITVWPRWCECGVVSPLLFVFLFLNLNNPLTAASTCLQGECK